LRIEAIKQPIWLRQHYCTSLQLRGSSFPQRLSSTHPRPHRVVSVPVMGGDWERSAGAGAGAGAGAVVPGGGGVGDDGCGANLNRAPNHPHKIDSGELYPACEAHLPAAYRAPSTVHTVVLATTACCRHGTSPRRYLPPSSARVTNTYGPSKTPSPLLLAASASCDMRLGRIRLQLFYSNL